jgi:hypothetical protein
MRKGTGTGTAEATHTEHAAHTRGLTEGPYWQQGLLSRLRSPEGHTEGLTVRGPYPKAHTPREGHPWCPPLR